MGIECTTGCSIPEHMIKCPICDTLIHVGVVHHCTTDSIARKKLKEDHECYAVEYEPDSEKCSGCEIAFECKVHCDINREEAAYQAEWDRKHEPPEGQVEEDT